MTVSKSQIPSTVVDQKLTDDESFKANQFLMTKGYRATQLYMKLAVQTNNKFALSVLKEVVDENQVHVSESLKLLYDLAEDEEKVLAHNTGKVEEISTASETGL